MKTIEMTTLAEIIASAVLSVSSVLLFAAPVMAAFCVLDAVLAIGPIKTSRRRCDQRTAFPLHHHKEEQR